MKCAGGSSTSYEETYRETKLPYTLFEVRFTPAGHDRSLLGAGRERLSTWIDLVCNDSDGFETYYAKAEELIKKINADAGESVKETGVRPHLGKFCKSLDSEDEAPRGTFSKIPATNT